MPTEDGFAPEDPLPLFLSGHADKNERQGSLLLLNTGILAMTATLVSIAIALSWGNPAKVLADVTASPTDFSARWSGTDQSTPKTQSIPDAQGSSPNARDTTARGEIAAASEPANQSQTENNGPSAEVLFSQFKVWAAKKDAQAQIEPVRPIQDARAQVLETAPAPAQPMQKHQNAKSAQHARAEVRHLQNPGRLEVRPDVQPPDQADQNVRAP